MKRLLFAWILGLLCVSSVAAQLAIAPDGALLPDGGVCFTVPMSISLSPAPPPCYMWGPVTPLYPVIWPNIPIAAVAATTAATHQTKGGVYGKPPSSRIDSWTQDNYTVKTDVSGY